MNILKRPPFDSFVWKKYHRQVHQMSRGLSAKSSDQFYEHHQHSGWQIESKGIPSAGDLLNMQS